MKKLSRLKKLTTVFVVAASVVVINAIIFYSNTFQLIYHQHSVNQALQVISQLERTLWEFNNTQISFQTYLVTNNQNYLSDYTVGVEQTNTSLKQLDTIFSYANDNKYINLLQDKITNSLNLFESQINGNKNQELLSTEVLTRDIQQLFEKIKANESKKLQTVIKASQISFVHTITTFSIATFGSVGLVVLFYLLLRSALMHLQVTERKLASCENRLQALMDASECVELIAPDATLLEINANGIKMMKALSANELLGKRVDTRVERGYYRAFAALHESVCRGNAGTLEFEINVQGTRRWVKTHAVPLSCEDGSFLNLSVTRDITEEKQIFSTLLRFQRLDTIGSNAGGIAHDLNNVLSPILLSAQLLRMKLPNNEYNSLLTTLENNVKRGANLIKQILLFARGVDQQTLIDLKAVFSDVELFITQTFPKSITCQISVSPYLGCVMGNTTQIHQVLMNLVVNARDAMPQGGKLTLHLNGADTETNFVIITVTDTGIGIPASNLEHIFEPFFTTKEVGKGTGLGLSTTKSIIKNHGGFIDVHSKVGEGTCFKVYLPVTKTTSTHILPTQLTSSCGTGILPVQ